MLRAATSLLLIAAAAGAAGQGAAAPPTSNLAGPPPASTTVFPLREVHAGLRGVAYTVFEGVRPEAMEVEILGRLKDALGPGRDLILARLHGSKPEYTGVVAGMSGSPVYVDGRLLGALSYRIGQFSKEPIAGITPIEQMLEVRDEGRAAEGIVADSAASGGAAEIRPMEAPLVFSGFSPETVERFGGGFRAMGLTPVSGLGAMDASRPQPEPLGPGSAVSAVLVEGDLSITGTCTVSYLDRGSLMACGHPLTQSGHVSLPMAKAEVLVTLASPLNAFKIVNATEVVGAFTEDRASAIAGRVGLKAAMIPVTIHLRREGEAGAEKTIHLGVANHRELTPQLMAASIYQSLQQVRSGSSEASYRVTGEIRLARVGAALPAVRLGGWETRTAFNPGAVAAALLVSDRFTQLFSNAQEQPQMTGVDLTVESSDRRRSAVLETARLQTPEVRAGETVTVEAVLRPYQAAAQTLTARVMLPKTLEAGTLRVLVSDGATLDRLLEPAAGHASSLGDTVVRLNGAHRNDRVYVSLLDRSAQAVLDAAALGEVPLSMANVLEPLKSSQRLRLNGESVTELGSMAADDEVSGSQVLSMTVR